MISSGLLISILVSQRYSSSLLEAISSQAENLAHAVALEALDKILINDLVALQKMLGSHMQSHSNISYIFIQRDGQILAHTFKNGIPKGLLKANTIEPGEPMRFQKIVATNGDHFLDIAWRVFEGRAGILRLGFSETAYYQKMTRLWLQMGGLTVVILLLAVFGSLFFVRRITRPLVELAQATQKVDKGELNVRVRVEGKDEVGQLAASFNQMVARIGDYTKRLEEQTIELGRSHQRVRTFCGIVEEVGALRSLNEIGDFLVKTLEGILKCRDMVLLFFNDDRDILFAISPRAMTSFEEPEMIRKARDVLEGLTKITFYEKMSLESPLVPKAFQDAPRQAIVPLHYENQLFGALVIACPGHCGCDHEEVNTVGLMLTHAAGVIKRAISQEEEIRRLRSRIAISAEFSGIVGKDPKMQGIYKLIEDIAPTDATVFIQGESGTGKELVARAIHQRSTRKVKPFMVINCSAYPATLLESELFGHEKGAFTGASRQKLGRFEQADKGTVFLDEIGEIALSAQIKLLRVLQTQKFERIGGERTLAVDVRIIAATNKEILKEVKTGHFREDLYYRLNVIPIQLPPLRDRRGDIPLLARHFLQRFAMEQGKEIEGFSSGAMQMLLNYSWPGNVRELENLLTQALVHARDSVLTPDLFPLQPATPQATASATLSATSTPLSLKRLDQVEAEYIQQVLTYTGGHKGNSCEILGISRPALDRKIKKYQLILPG